jgi:hypothetical protein
VAAEMRLEWTCVEVEVSGCGLKGIGDGDGPGVIGHLEGEGLLLVGALDHVLPRGVRLWLAFTAKFFCPVLEMCDIGLAPLVSDGVVLAPLGCDPSEVAAGVLALGVVAHDERVLLCRRRYQWKRVML